MPPKDRYSMDTLNKVRESTDSLVRPQAVKKDSADSLTRTQTTNARLSSESISRTQTSKAKESTESLSRTQTTKRDSQILAPRLNRLSTIRTRDTSDSIDVLNALRPKEHIDRLGQVMMSADSLIGPRPVDKSKQSLEKKPDKKVEKKKATEQDIIGILKWKYSKVEASEIYSVKFSPDGMYLAVGNGDSKISIYSTITNNLEFVLDPHMPKPLPVTAICFRPNHESFGTKNVLAASYADGSVRHWHVTSGKSLGSLQDQEQTNHLTYRQDGQYFATVGTDLQVRSYDAHTLKNITTASYGSRDTAAGHSNRIFCCKYNPTNPNILITAGWDEAIQVWDMRTQVSVRSIFGPHICGDSLDFSNDGKNLMSGSYSAKEGVQLWEWDSGTLLDSIPWNSDDPSNKCLIYSAHYSKKVDHILNIPNRYIIAGGGGNDTNEIKIFEAASKRVVASVRGLSAAVYSVDTSPDGSLLALGGGGKELMVYDWNDHHSQDA